LKVKSCSSIAAKLPDGGNGGVVVFNGPNGHKTCPGLGLDSRCLAALFMRLLRPHLRRQQELELELLELEPELELEWSRV
jgi:hypothetical protein